MARVDPASGRIKGRAKAFGPTGPVAITAGVVVAGPYLEDELWRVDARTGATLGSTSLIDSADDLAAHDGIVWAVSSDTVTLVDARTGAIRTQPGGALRAGDVVVFQGVAWLAGEHSVTRYDARSARPRGDPIDVRVSMLAAGDGGVWGAEGHDVVRLDSEHPRRVRVQLEAGEIAVAAGLVWVIDELEGDLAIIEAASGRVLADRVKIASRAGSITGVSDGVWVGDYSRHELIRITATKVS